MTEISHFQQTLKKWALSERILRCTLDAVTQINLEIPPRERITVTAPLNLLEEFEVYRQPDGAASAKKVIVGWNQNGIRVTRSDREFAERFETEEVDGSIELVGITVQELATSIVSQVP